jgi:tetratricopeptide (TPR) repeat protein
MALQNCAHVLGEQLGRTEEALEFLNKAVALYPDYVPVRGGRGILLARLGKREPAQRDAEECVLLDSKPSTLYQVAGIYALTCKQYPVDRHEALRLLSSALLKGYGLDRVDKDADFAPLRAYPEYGRLLAAVRALRPW